MVRTPSQHEILAFALYELRLLLANELGTNKDGDPAVRVAAHLAYALHNHALAVLEGRSFDSAQAIQAIAKVDTQFGEKFVQHLSEAMSRVDRKDEGK